MLNAGAVCMLNNFEFWLEIMWFVKNYLLIENYLLSVFGHWGKVFSTSLVINIKSITCEKSDDFFIYTIAFIFYKNIYYSLFSQRFCFFICN